MCSIEKENKTSEFVKEYYGKTLTPESEQLTDACSWDKSCMPDHFKKALKLVHCEVKQKHFGCGLVAPEALEGTRVLDLGSGSGMDVYTLSNLVQENGHVTGVDMTDELLDVAKKYIDYHRDASGYKESNVDFVKGYIEDLKTPGISSESYDVVVSNCVVCLSTDKKAVLSEVYRVLKNGGEMYFSDMYADRPVPAELSKNNILWGEGLSGSLYWKDFLKLAREVGFQQPYMVSSRKLTLSPKMKELTGDIQYAALTFRLFKLPPTEDDTFYTATYNGNIPNYPCTVNFHKRAKFQKGSPVIIDGFLAEVLRSSRFNKSFTVEKYERDEDPFKC